MYDNVTVTFSLQSVCNIVTVGMTGEGGQGSSLHSTEHGG